MWWFLIFRLCRCDSIEKLKKRSETLEREIQDSQNFKDFYQFTFNFAKNPGQKGLGEWLHVTSLTLSLETAMLKDSI